MNCKKVIVLGLLMLSLTLTYGAVARAMPEERRTVYSMENYFLGLKVNIVAPYVVYPSENINITIRVEASGDTQVEFIHVNIYGLINETEEVSLTEIYIYAVPYEDDYIVTIRNDTSPGLIYGKMEWKWTHEGATITPPPAGFVVTYVKDLELEELQADYDSLLANYTELKNYKGELGSTRNLMYIFVATTAVSAATVFVLLIRRPKRLWT